MFEPSKKILKKYADVLVKFALNSGKGVKKGEVVQCTVPDIAKPLLVALHQSILEAGGHPLMRMIPTGIDKTFYQLANDKQLTFFPKKYTQARVDLIDHSIGILADHDPLELKDINPAKIMKGAESSKKIREWIFDKEINGKFTWTLALYGTPAMAKEAGLSLETYWKQIINACFLDKENPIQEWKAVFKEQERIKKKLNSHIIEKIHVEAAGIDLWIKLGKNRKWIGGSGRNIPSFEIFTSPDWRGTEGYITFNQPIYYHGNVMKNVRMKFKNGIVVKSDAKQGKKTLQAMLSRPNANKVGEFSLTDSRMTRISKFMANTLYDENVGDKQGNTHIAIGSSYKEAYRGDPSKVTKSQWKKMGYNSSGEHCDFISTEDRKVTAHLEDGSIKVIYLNGKFTV